MNSWTISRSESHDAVEGLCDQCGREYAAAFEIRCSTCVYEIGTVVGVYLLIESAVREFLIAHGLAPVVPTSHRFWAAFQYEEAIRSTDPFEAEFTFSINGDSLALTVDEGLTIVDVTRT